MFIIHLLMNIFGWFLVFGYYKLSYCEHFMCKSLCGHSFVSLGQIPKNGTGHMIGVCLTFKNTDRLFCKEVVSFYIPVTCLWSIPSPTLGKASLFNFSHSSGCAVVLIWIFLMTTHVEHLFMWLFAISVSSLVKCLFTSFTCFRLFSFYWVLRVLYIISPEIR